MSKKDASVRPETRLPKGLYDISAQEIRATEEMLGTIRGVFERYGFEPLDTPAIEYTDALGKFLPDQDRPNEGVFSFKDDDEQWLSLRYDLTAPLARYVAENYQHLPKPFRRYQVGPVWRNEKPGPGRFRQFMQFDADTVGASSSRPMPSSACWPPTRSKRSASRVGNTSSRSTTGRCSTACSTSVGLGDNASKRLAVLRAIDKLDRLGVEGVRALLGKGRKDKSGDYTKGVELTTEQTAPILKLVQSEQLNATDFASALTSVGGEGLKEVAEIGGLVAKAGYDDRIKVDLSVVRGLEYYTGPVFEVELLAPIKDERGQPIRLGSVVSGGRYDGLVERFTGEKIPATGISIGVSRLLFGLQRLGKYKGSAVQGPVVVLVLRPRPHRRLPENGASLARGRHPRRDVSRRGRHESANEIRRPAWLHLASSSRAATRRPKARCRSRTSYSAPRSHRSKTATNT